MLLTFLLAGLATVTVPTSVGQTDKGTSPPPAKPKRICRSIEHSGSMFRDRVCKTAEEWRVADESSTGSEDAQTLQRGAGAPKPE